MASRSVRTKKEEEIREPIHNRAIVRLWAAIIGPVLFECLPVSALDDRPSHEPVRLKTCGQHDDVCGDESFLGFDTVGDNLQDLLIG